MPQECKYVKSILMMKFKTSLVTMLVLHQSMSNILMTTWPTYNKKGSKRDVQKKTIFTFFIYLVFEI